MSVSNARTVAVAAYLAAIAAPASADWRAVADALYSAMPATRGRAIASAVDHGDSISSGAVPRWFADWKLGKVYSLDSLSVTFADGVAVRVNLAKAPGKLPRVGHACRVAVAFYRARTGLDTVPAFASLVSASDGQEFDAEACSALTADLRVTGIVPGAVRPAVTAEAVERMERELMRRRTGLDRALAREAELIEARAESARTRGPADGDSHRYIDARVAVERANLDGAGSTQWIAAIEACEAELAVMQAAAFSDPSPSNPPAVEAATVDHIEPLAICPAVGMPCKVDCGFRAGCTPRAAVAASDPLDAADDGVPAPHLAGDDAPARSVRKPRAPRRAAPKPILASRGRIAPASMAIGFRPTMRATFAPLHSAPTL